LTLQQFKVIQGHRLLVSMESPWCQSKAHVRLRTSQ